MARWNANKRATLADWMDEGFGLAATARCLHVPLKEAREEWAKIRDQRAAAIAAAAVLHRKACLAVADAVKGLRLSAPPVPPPAPPPPPPPVTRIRDVVERARARSAPRPVQVEEPAPPAGELSQLIPLCEAYMLQHGLSETQFGVMAAREPALMATLRRGRHPRAGKEAQIRALLAGPPSASTRSRATRLAERARATVAAAAAIEVEAKAHRLGDPVQQAKRHIQAQGFAVFSASVVDPAKTGWQVGTKPDPLTDDELIAMARRRGWEGPR